MDEGKVINIEFPVGSIFISQSQFFLRGGAIKRKLGLQRCTDWPFVKDEFLGWAVLLSEKTDGVFEPIWTNTTVGYK